MVALLFLLISSLLYTNAITLQRYVFSADEQEGWGARCLDGSGSGFYFQAATNSDNKLNWYIEMQGGGFCLPNPSWPNVDDCNSRAKTTLGSSSQWPAGLSYSPVFPIFDTWNLVFIPYCGGDLHTGQRNESINGLYYAGHLTILAITEKLKQTGSFSAASKVAVTGGSAGGIGVFVNIDTFQEAVPNATVIGMPNAGWFINVPTLNQAYLGINGTGWELAKLTGSYVNQKCAASLKDQWPMCIGANFSYPFITASMFIAQSLFDAEQLVYQDGAGTNFSDPTQNTYRVAFGKVMRETLQQVIASKTNGIYATANFIHVVPTGDTTNGYQMGVILDNWLTSLVQPKGNLLIQDVSNCTFANCQAVPTLPPV